MINAIYRFLYRAVRRENERLRAELAEVNEAHEVIRDRLNGAINRNASLRRQLVACRRRHSVT